MPPATADGQGLLTRFARRAGIPVGASPPDIVRAVQLIPYGRPRARTPEGVIEEWTGTCSTKHALLAELLRTLRPELSPRLVHRVHLVDTVFVGERFGLAAAAAVPHGGLVDVHRYLVITLHGADVIIDVTFPGDPAWDGHGSMTPACGEGQDVPAGADADADKARLEAEHCDPAVREPFIAALAAAGDPHS